ncbi:MAG: DUF1592 domain-containing protein [Gemmataceae bacterium]
MTVKTFLACPAAALLALALAVVGPAGPHRLAADEPFGRLATEYTKEVRPLLQRYCARCHSAKNPEGDVNLESFVTLADVRKAPKTWQKVLEMLGSEQMPPRGARRPGEVERGRLVGWVRGYLKAEAVAQAGDPGPVVLRRLNNAEFTYSVRDLTGVDLQPASQFPADGAAGEGFTNTGQALAMSPALLAKYLDAAKEIAAHAVLLPDGIRFSPSTTRRDWTNEVLARIRQTYRQYSDSQGGTRVNLQGIVFDTNDGGRLPLESHLAATLAERDALLGGKKTVEAVARERRLNAKYLAALWQMLTSNEPSALLDQVRAPWRGAKPGDAPALAAEIGQWQKVLTRFQSVGHMKSWMVPVTPLTSRQEVRFKVPGAAAGKEVSLFLAAGDAGDGANDDVVVWQRPRLVIPGRPDLPLREVRDFTQAATAWRDRLFAAAAKCLAAAEEAGTTEKLEVGDLARRHDIEADVLAAWLGYLGIGVVEAPKLNHFTTQLTRVGGHEFVRGWGRPETPSLVANSSGRLVHIPGEMRPHGVCVHPSPTLNAAVGWRSPVTGAVRVEGRVTHAHPLCGNGITWSLELRRGATRRRLAGGIVQGRREATLGPIERIDLRKGDLLSILIGPRDGNHACDLTDVELTLKSDGREWSLTRDVADDVLAGNPHADRFGNPGVWHFYSEPVKETDTAQAVPNGSLLARWLTADQSAEKRKLAADLQKLLTGAAPSGPDHPDAHLYRQMNSLGSPLFRKVPRSEAGVDPALFGRVPDGSAIDPASLCVHAPAVVEVRLPADLFAGAELVATGIMHPHAGAGGSVQLYISSAKPSALSGLRPDLPVLVAETGDARKRWDRAFDDFRRLFPAALCYTKIVPVDEVVTLTLFHREDEPLCRLMLDEKQKADLDRLWEELHFVSHDALTLVDAFQQLMEYATQDSNPKLFEPYRKPIHDRAAAFRKALVEAEPKHVDAVIDFADRAYRRPLTDAERRELRGLYARLREQKLPHDEAVRLTLARVLVSPAFLYRLEKSPPGARAAPVSDWELASRLSYFLWSSPPDAELRGLAAKGRLADPNVLAAQARRMSQDDRVRRLAVEFGCSWLHVHGFDKLDEKSERHFPTFAGLRGDLYEESIRLFADLVRRDLSVLSLLDADHTFVNEALAKHYGIPGVSGPEWRRVDGVRKYGRGGILALGATLAKQSGASRTSPILRGNWVSEVLLGERLPRPPKDVPPLPDAEADTGLTVRQLVEKHASDPRCAVCHVRIDPFGFALEGYDAIGRRRDRDLGNRPLDTRSKLKDGTPLDGLDGLRDYLLTKRRGDVLRQFSRKLLGYALGRSVQLSDELLLDEIQRQLEGNGHRISAAVEAIVRSRQFREIRGQDVPPPESH